MDELVAMLKDPSQYKKKKRRASLSRQHPISIAPPPSRSRTLPSATKQEVPAASDDTLKRQSNSLKPKRPAPNKPAPPPPGRTHGVSEKPSQHARPAPAPTQAPSTNGSDSKKYAARKPTPIKPLRTADTWKADSMENLLVGSGERSLGETTSGGKSGEVHHGSKTTHTKMADTALDKLVHRNENYPLSGSSELLQNNGAVDLEDDEDIDESMFLGGAETHMDEGEDDFILEPPDEYSESSLNGLEEPPDSPKSKKEKDPSSLVIQFHQPSTPGEDDEIPGEVFDDAGDVFTDEQHKVLSHGTSNGGERGKVKKSKKKKREGREYPESGKHSKHKSKKRRSSSTKNLLTADEEMSFPEYELDRGLDKIPMQAHRQQTQHTDRTSMSKHAATTDSIHATKPDDAIGKLQTMPHDKLERRSSYDDFDDDEPSLPWLDEPVDNRELSFEELDAYSQDINDDNPRVVYKEDVAELIW